MRIGIGYDLHKLVNGRKLILGGIEVPHTLGLEGHSDADVLAHAIMDALLGATALGDIGRHFPDTDPKYKDASSIDLLKHVVGLISKYKISNIDATIIAEKPKLAEHIDKMRIVLAKACGINVDSINVKATTNEGIGLIGKGEAIAVYAVALLKL